jgi:hypothetical protein
MGDSTHKIHKRKQAGDMAQVVQHLPGKYKALSSNLSTGKRKKKSRENILLSPIPGTHYSNSKTTQKKYRPVATMNIDTNSLAKY